MEWFKFYGPEYLADPKMFALTASERSCWLTLLCLVSVTNKKGAISFLKEDQLMGAAGVSVTNVDWEVTKGVLKKFEKLGMITISNDTVTVCKWESRQEAFVTNAERQKRYRDRQKRNASVTSERNESNARVEENRIDITSEASASGKKKL